MAYTFKEVQKLAYELPQEQRLLLANSLWESKDGGTGEAESEVAWAGEIERRVAEIKSGKAVTFSLHEVEADLQAIVGP